MIDRLESSVTKIDPVTAEAVGRGQVSGNLDGIAVGEGGVWLLDSTTGTVTMLDPGSFEPIDTITVGEHPGDITVGLGAVWVANQADGTITKIDPETRLTETVEIHQPVVSVVADEPTGTLWAAVAKPVDEIS